MPEVEWKEKLHTLPLNAAMEKVDGPKGIFSEFLERKPNDPEWNAGGLWHDQDGCGVPGLWLFSWYDISTAPNLAMVEHIRRTASDAEVRANQYVIMAPLPHCAFFRSSSPLTLGERKVSNIEFPYEEQVFNWFDRWLKGADSGFLESTPKVQYFTFGIDQWQTAASWPPEGSGKLTYYLSSEGRANSLFGNGALMPDLPGRTEADRFTYDPTMPVPSLGGGICCIGGAIDPGAFDQRPVETRADVLVYTSEALSSNLEVTGSVEVVLYVSSDAKDTDFTAKLIDVFPDGTAYNLDETIQRVRYRDGYDKEVFMEAGQVYEVRLSSMVTSNVFKEGHRIRLDISSSNFPRFARNLNTGGPNYNESKPTRAQNTVHHSSVHPSRIVLTVAKKSR